jgi:hypothetical protein
VIYVDKNRGSGRYQECGDGCISDKRAGCIITEDLEEKRGSELLVMVLVF